MNKIWERLALWTLTAVVGLGTYIGSGVATQVKEAVATIHEIKVDLAVLAKVVQDGKEQRLDYQEANTKAHVDFMSKLDNFVSKKEFDVQLLALALRLKEVEAKLASIEVQIAILKSGLKQNPPP